MLWLTAVAFLAQVKDVAAIEVIFNQMVAGQQRRLGLRHAFTAHLVGDWQVKEVFANGGGFVVPLISTGMELLRLHSLELEFRVLDAYWFVERGGRYSLCLLERRVVLLSYLKA